MDRDSKNRRTQQTNKSRNTYRTRSYNSENYQRNRNNNRPYDFQEDNYFYGSTSQKQDIIKELFDEIDNGQENDRNKSNRNSQNRQRSKTRNSTRQRQNAERENDIPERKYERDIYDSSKRVTRKKSKNARKSDFLKSGVGKISREVFSKDASDENMQKEPEYDSITKSIKTSRKNKKLLDELKGNKKPLTKGQRKLKSFLFSSIVIIVALAIGATLSLTLLFKCEEIKVEGTTRYTENEIIEASGLKYGENIFISDKSAAAEKIEKNYPYIEKADITFSIPNAINIKVTEATPKYYIQSGNKYYIISKESKLLEFSDSKVLDIPSIKGCKILNQNVGEIAKVENDKIITVLNEVATSMENNNVVGVKEIDLSNMSEIELNFENRITIVIGMPEYIDYKIKTAMKIIETKLAPTDSGRLDCSNLIEGRTDDKDNASYFQPNHLANENINPNSSIPTEITTVPENAVPEESTIPETDIVPESAVSEENTLPENEFTENQNDDNTDNQSLESSEIN